MKSLILEDGISHLNKQNIEFALIHEAAITAFGLNYSVFIKSVDVVISDQQFMKYQRRLVGSLLVSGDSSRENLGGSNTMGTELSQTTTKGTIIRLWSESLLGISLVQVDKIWNNNYSCYVLDPELVLEKLELSPDIEWLLEQRARLAMVLYADQMSDDELLLFHKYVRGD